MSFFKIKSPKQICKAIMGSAYGSEPMKLEASLYDGQTLYFISSSMPLLKNVKQIVYLKIEHRETCETFDGSFSVSFGKKVDKSPKDIYTLNQLFQIYNSDFVQLTCSVWKVGWIDRNFRNYIDVLDRSPDFCYEKELWKGKEDYSKCVSFASPMAIVVKD